MRRCRLATVAAAVAALAVFAAPYPAAAQEPLIQGKTLNQWVAQLKAKSPENRVEAAEALGASKDARAVDALLVALRDRNSDVRRSSAISLGKIADRKAAPGLIGATGDLDDLVRDTAADSLGAIGAPAVEALLAAAKAPGWRVRSGAAKALGIIKDARAVPALLALLTDSNDEVAAMASGALSGMGGPAVEALKRAFDSANPELRYAAGAALAEARPPEVDFLLGRLRSEQPLVRREPPTRFR